jgi:site-specific DNA recombinase
VPDRYDDGGLSGGTLDRPALKRLLADIEDGRVDVVVVYKIDRLSRSLMDFAKLVEVFERCTASRSSPSRSPSTPRRRWAADAEHSAQLRPVRARGFGRAHPRQVRRLAGARHVDGRHTAAGLRRQGAQARRQREEADLVRLIFSRFLRIGSATKLAQELRRAGHTTKTWTTQNGHHRPGKPLDKGALYKILGNRVYLGEAVHKGTPYPGEHAAIIDRALWDKVHAILATNTVMRANHSRAQTPALLKGLIFAPGGHAMTPSHTRKAGKLYRYYVATDAIRQGYSECAVAACRRRRWRRR